MADIEQLRRSFTFKTTEAGLPIQLDVQVGPESVTSQPLPVIISYHGGGLFVGSRKDPMYEQLARPFLEAGYAIIYPDYRLLDPSSCWDELSDVRDALAYIISPRFAQDTGVQLDHTRVCLAGFSAGCYLARIAAIHVVKALRDTIQLKGIMLYYGMGGDSLLDYWVQPHLQRKSIRPPHLDGAAPALPECSSASYTAGMETNELCPARSAVAEWYWTSGDFLDLCYAAPGLSDTLRKLPYENRLDHLATHRPDLEDVHPALFLAKSSLAQYWPPTLLIHGSADPLVPLQESQTTQNQLAKLGVEVKLHLVQKGNHNLDDDELLAAGDTRITEAKKAAFVESIAYVKEKLG